MSNESNKIIVVDDNKSDLQKLSEAFYKNGLGCKSLEFDAMYSEPLKGIRIAFFDVNLCNSTNEIERNSKLCQALRDYIAKDNGAYVLVFWTSDISWVNSFTDYVKDRDENDIPVPYYIESIDKNEVLSSEEKLKERLEKILELPSVKLAFEYENIIAESIHNTISNIIGTIPFSGWANTKEFEENCKRVFSAIAFQHEGKNAMTNPDKAIKEALIPICMSSFIEREDSFWSEYLNLTGNRRSHSFPDGYNVSKLNNIFNLDLKVDNRNIKKTDRGALCIIQKKDAEQHFVDFKYEEWLKKTIPLESKDNNLIQNIKDDSKLVCVEFSSACDYSWNKARIEKYLLGVLIPSEYSKSISQNKPDYCLNLSECCFFLEEKDQFFCFNLNYAFTLTKEKESLIGDPICQLKKELMDMIGNRYANHISRIGITSFR